MSMPTPRRDDEFWWASPPIRDALQRDPAALLRDRGISVPPDLPRAVVHEFVRVMYLLWVNGSVVPIDRFHIDPADEGLLFGRGVWESTRTVNGTPWLWDYHLDRLKESAGTLNIALDPARLPSAEQVTAHVRSLTTQDVLVRLNVTAGRPGRPGMVWMSTAPLPVPATPLRLKTWRNPVEKGQAYLTLKTFQYATRLRIAQQANQGEFDSALMIDDADNLLETVHANLFVRLPDGWATPTADGGFLPGTVRRHLLDHSPIPIREQPIPLSRLRDIQEAFVTNSSAGIVPVVRIDDHAIPVGDDTRFLIHWIEPPPSPHVTYRFRDHGNVPR
jgi:branched-subunit amino acid aminotransferase/4-amino-4-deoxychorismate lyase